MEDKNCDLLFEYLRSILYDSKVKTLEVDQVEEPYQKLCMGLRVLESAVREMKEYSADLSKGRLSAKVPGRDNFLCENLKNIHANLNHLTWQAKQVAKGDYTQTVSFLGEFSEAFNTMTMQLREREASLKEEAKKEKAHAAIMENYNQLLMELIARSDEEILVVSMEDSRILYCNENVSIWASRNELYGLCLEEQKKQSKNQNTQKDTYEWNWEVEDSSRRYYQITTGVMQWQGERAYVHIIREVTEQKEREAKLQSEAYQDLLTGIGNRHYFQKKAMEALAEEGKSVLCYCDLDHLKQINDTYGHTEGDWYIRYFVDTVRFQIREDDVFARMGGDEFCMILRKCTKEKAEQKMQKIQKLFASEKAHPYAKGFSFGICEIPKNRKKRPSLEELLRKTDAAMYEQKRAHKRLDEESAKECTKNS